MTLWLKMPLFMGLLYLTGCHGVTELKNIDADKPDLAKTAPAMHFFPASESFFLRQGRVDFPLTGGVVLIWQGSLMATNFEGVQLTLNFGAAQGQNHLNVKVDGETEVVSVPEGAGYSYVWPRKLSAGQHGLAVFKRSEAAVGHVQLLGIELPSGGTLRRPAEQPSRLRMEFLGDSIMVGACNEDGAVDQWEDRRTHNHALSYTYLTASAFGADYRCQAVSGMGIATGWVEVRANEMWDKLYPRADSPRTDLLGWQPDVLFVNLGENDDSYTRANSRPFPKDYAAGYLSLVGSIRAAYPKSEIVLLRGGMYGGAKSDSLRAAWESVVQRLEAADPHIRHFVFRHWSELHPRVTDDRAMADELTRWLKEQLWMKPYLNP